MINLKKIKIFNKYSGDIDVWARFAKKKNEREIMIDNDWILIEEIIQNIGSIKKNLVLESYKKEII